LPETEQAFWDNPEKTTAVITAGAIAVFGVVHEMVPPQHQDVVKLLGSLDLMINLASWRAIRQNLKIHSKEPAADETALPIQPQPEAA
jgi:hypothetical protein